VVLGGLAHNSTNTCSGCASDQASFEASAEESAKDCTADASDSRAFTGADAAPTLVVPLVVAVVRMARLIVLSAVTAFSDAAVEVTVAVMTARLLRTPLRHSGHRCEQKRCEQEACKQESGAEPSFSFLHSDLLSSSSCGMC
jgi:hypothetical protein